MNDLTCHFYFDIVINCSYKNAFYLFYNTDVILFSFKLIVKLLLTVVGRALCPYIFNRCNVIASLYASVFVIQDLS